MTKITGKELTHPLNFFIGGTPRPKQSFKYSIRSGGYHVPRIKAWQDMVGWSAREYLNNKIGWAGEMIASPLAFDLAFYMPTRRRVDGDNLEKGVMDGLKGVIIADDDIWTVRSMVKNFYHVSETPDGLAGVSVMISPWVEPC